MVLLWTEDGSEIKAWVVSNPTDPRTAHWSRRIANSDFFFRPGLTWPLRTTSGLGLRALPAGCIFGHKGPAAFVAGDNPDILLALLALTNSAPFRVLVSLQMAFGSYEVGVIQRTPIPSLTTGHKPLATAARRAWSLKRTLDTVNETSHAFLLPAALRPRLGGFDPPAIEAELARIQADIDAIAFDLYGFDDSDRWSVISGQRAGISSQGPAGSEDGQAAEDEDEARRTGH